MPGTTEIVQGCKAIALHKIDPDLTLSITYGFSAPLN